MATEVIRTTPTLVYIYDANKNSGSVPTVSEYINMAELKYATSKAEGIIGAEYPLPSADKLNNIKKIEIHTTLNYPAKTTPNIVFYITKLNISDESLYQSLAYQQDAIANYKLSAGTSQTTNTTNKAASFTIEGDALTQIISFKKLYVFIHAIYRTTSSNISGSIYLAPRSSNSSSSTNGANFTIETPSNTFYVNTSSGFKTATPYVLSGGIWKPATVKRFNGSSWQ